MLKIWTDKKGKVHCIGKGEAVVQLKEVDAVVAFLAQYGSTMNAVSSKILHGTPATLQMTPLNTKRGQGGKSRDGDPVKDEAAR